MSDYFDDSQVQKRVGRQYRRRFVFQWHIILSVIAMIWTLYGRYEMRHYDNRSQEFLLNELFVWTMIYFIPVALHYVWLRYRENMEAAVDREMKTAYEYRKRKHDEYAYAHLEDTGEFVPEDDYPQKRLERR